MPDSNPSGIYGIIHIKSKKIYVGSAINITKRWREHRHYLRLQKHRNPYLQSAWNKHGENSFEFVVLEKVKKSNLLIKREQHWLNYTNAFDRHYGYNIAVTAGSQLGIKRSKKTKKKLSSVLTGRKLTLEHSKAISNALKGRIHSDKARSLLSKAHARLTNKQHSKLLDDYFFKGYHIKELAENHGLSRTSIQRIIGGEVYKKQITEWLNDNNLKQFPSTTHGQSKLSKNDVFDILDMKLEGIRHREIAKKYDMAEASIHMIIHGINHKDLRDEFIKKRGLGKADIDRLNKRSGLRLTNQVQNKIRALIKSGMKQVDIAHEFGVSPQSICDIKYGRL
jgi:group I intron endonuclease